MQFSIVARLPTSAAAQIVFVQYLFGVAVVEAVRGLPGYERLGICLKWPNDIYADMGSDQEGEGMERYKKIGGILVNSSFSDGSFSLVIGASFGSSADLRSSSSRLAVCRLRHQYDEPAPDHLG